MYETTKHNNSPSQKKTAIPTAVYNTG